MDYGDTIQSIVYSFLSDVGYKVRTEEEDSTFDFNDWWEEVNGYEILHSIVDSYACGHWRHLLEIILKSSSDPDTVDSGLWEGAKGWKQTVGCIAFELMRTDAQAHIVAHVENNAAMFEAGGVLPETNEKQIWLGKDAPLIIIEEGVVKTMHGPTIKWVEVVETSSFIKLQHLRMALVFEGKPDSADPRDLKELVMGGRRAIRPRRVYIQDSGDVSVQELLTLAMRHGWVTIPDYEHYKTVLPQLSLD